MSTHHGPRALLLALPIFLAAMLMVAGCAPTRFLDDDEYLLDRVSVRSDNPEVPTSMLRGYIRQHPNSRWFSLFKVPLGIYCISGTDSTRRINRFFQRIGEPPVVYDSIQAQRARDDIRAATRNLGYLNADVQMRQRYRHGAVRVTFDIEPGEAYVVDSIGLVIDDPALNTIVRNQWHHSLLHAGMPLNINILDRERSRIVTQLQDTGYYRFTKNFIRFEADTTVAPHHATLTMHIQRYRTSTSDSLSPHPRYRLAMVRYLTDIEPATLQQEQAGPPTMPIDSTHIGSSRFYARGRRSLTPSFILSKSNLRPGSYVSDADMQSTYSNLSTLAALVGTSIAMEPSAADPTLLNANVSLVTARRHGISFDVEGTNSAGDLGAAASVGYQNHNLFRRSTLLGLKVRGAFEAIKGLEGYADQNYIEYSAEANLNFPEFMFPFLSRTFRRSSKAQSIASLMYDSQDRPEFHRRVLTAAWRYRWSRLDTRLQHRIDLVDLNYVFMPWISETFRREYLSDNGSRNAVLRYNYENLFIMRWGYQFQYTNIPATSQNASYGKNAFSVRVGIETAGNLLRGASMLFDAQHSDELDAYTLFNIAYAQYVKGDFDFAKSFRLDDRNSLAMHAAFGIAFPYGNSRILPYEKRYFSGGANSVRGWGVRGLGPGSFGGSDGRVDFIRQTGDVKLDLSLEWRTHLFWKLDGAAFIDAGNVWTIREYEEQPGGQFRFDKFWRQVAAAYGLGIRLNFGYFLLRLDAGMKAINPAVEKGKGHYPIITPNLKRDFHLHFAVGLPF